MSNSFVRALRYQHQFCGAGVSCGRSVRLRFQWQMPKFAPPFFAEALNLSTSKVAQNLWPYISPSTQNFVKICSQGTSLRMGEITIFLLFVPFLSSCALFNSCRRLWGPFLARDSMLSALYVIANPFVRLSVCPSVCLSHGWISRKRLNVSSKFFHHLIGPTF